MLWKKRTEAAQRRNLGHWQMYRHFLSTRNQRKIVLWFKSRELWKPKLVETLFTLCGGDIGFLAQAE